MLDSMKFLRTSLNEELNKALSENKKGKNNISISVNGNNNSFNDNIESENGSIVGNSNSLIKGPVDLNGRR